MPPHYTSAAVSSPLLRLSNLSAKFARLQILIVVGKLPAEGLCNPRISRVSKRLTLGTNKKN